MHVRITLPRLLWPDTAAAATLRAMTLPGLSALLGKALPQTTPGATLEAAFAAACAVPLGAIAPVRRTGEITLPAPDTTAFWLCADPVAVHFTRDQFVLADPESLALSADEVAQLTPLLQEALAAVGHFEFAGPTRGYLQLNHPTPTHFSALTDVAGRPVALFLPEGEDARHWARITNEVQTQLSAHPLNRAREAAGRLPVNSLWFWGAGAMPTLPPQPALRVLSDSAFATGLAHVQGGQAVPLDEVAAALDTAGDLHILIEALHGPALYGDFTCWQAHLTALETGLFAPLAAALRAGRIRRITLDAPGERQGLVWHIAHRPWAFWRKPQPLDILAVDTARA